MVVFLSVLFLWIASYPLGFLTLLWHFNDVCRSMGREPPKRPRWTVYAVPLLLGPFGAIAGVWTLVATLLERRSHGKWR